MELLNALGLDLKVFVAQFVNFAILYFILAKFAIPKVTAMVKARQDEIDAGLKNAEAAQLALEQAQEKEAAVVAQANSQARQIINEAKQKGKQAETKIVAQAKEQAQTILTNGEKQAQTEKAKLMQSAKEELAEIISIGMRNLADEKIDPTKIKDSYLKQGLVG
ncbi:MAG: F0F1 ATP synthase subunit B [bacterium]|nr:F0F1 ATP synthase subunit B [bacterium]